MPDNFTIAIAKSSKQFEEICVPELKKLTGCEFMCIEGNHSIESQRMLDIMAGIDSWMYKEKYGVIGIASRIQKGINWETFTVRKSRESGTKTEFDKVSKAIENGSIYPFYTVQAYIKDSKIEGMAICRTKSLYQLIKDKKYKIRQTGANQDGQSIFYAVKWSDFKEGEINIFTKENSWVNQQSTTPTLNG